MSIIHQVSINTKGEVTEHMAVEQTNANNYYEMIARVWVTSKNKYIREWTLNEYATLNPNNKYIIDVKLDNNEEFGDVVVHCIEYGIVNICDSNGNEIINYHKTVDYSKNNKD